MTLLDDEGPEGPDEAIADCELDRRLGRVSVKLDDKVLKENELKEAPEDVAEVRVFDELPDVVLNAIIRQLPSSFLFGQQQRCADGYVGDRRPLHIACSARASLQVRCMTGYIPEQITSSITRTPNILHMKECDDARSI